jgi:redox-sensitive bicupin YhaK (pirin superfamily)
MDEPAQRAVRAVVPSRKARPAPGLLVDRPFPGPEVDFVDPWLMLDHFGPERIAPGESGGLNPHPHRGFETVTLILEGAIEHQDSSGGRGLIEPGGVQWMTAASGIVHAEYRAPDLVRRGGTLHGVQLWLNLPRSRKMDPPGYQDLPATRIPVVESRGARVRVIAGRHAGVQGPARSFTSVTLLHVMLDAGGSAALRLPEGHNALVYVVEGAAQVQARDVPARAMALFDGRGEAVALRAGQPAQLLVLAGEPIGEPVVSWGPFVMNTREEILQARDDYLAGRMGSLDTAV